MHAHSKKKGFTLSELLITVSIISVLVAVAIPIFSQLLEKSRETTDLSNMSAARSAAVMQFTETDVVSEIYYFDAEKGILVSSPDGITPYGKGTAKVGGCEDYYLGNGLFYTGSNAVTDKILQVEIRQFDITWSDVLVNLTWVDPE